MRVFAKAMAMASLAVATWSLFTSCALREDSTQYTQLAPRAEANPSPDAIVGMWHYNGDRRAPKSSTSLLFRSNGEGLARGRYQMAQDAFTTQEGEQQATEFTWRYEGGGKWSDSIGATYRLANGKLLRSAIQYINAHAWETWTTGEFGPTNRVFERLE